MKNKIRYRVCKVKTCGKKYEVNPKYPLFPCCSIPCAIAYQALLRANKEAKDWKVKKASMKIDTHVKENKKELQNSINKLSRMIDEHFENNTCIDCGLPLDKEKHQIDGCHLIARGGNSTLRYNLHNLHSGHNHCNFYNPKHEGNYKEGLIKRYGIDYLNMIEGLQIKYKEIHLSNLEIAEKLKTVRVLVRTFNTYTFKSSVDARNIFNIIIGIYK
jgi:hypothetical protein